MPSCPRQCRVLSIKKSPTINDKIISATCAEEKNMFLFVSVCKIAQKKIRKCFDDFCTPEA